MSSEPSRAATCSSTDWIDDVIGRHGTHRVGGALIDLLDPAVAATAVAWTVYASG